MKPLLPGPLAAGLCLLLASCHRPKENTAAPSSGPAPAPVRVSAAPAVKKPMPRYLRLTGELAASTDASVAADTTGKVFATPVERGSAVKRGDVLVSLDRRTAEFSKTEADAALALAKSRLALADSELERNAPLAKSRALSAADMARLQADRDGRLADVTASKARLDQATKALEDTSIRAPFDGVVAERLVSTGEYVRPDSVVARIVAPDPLRVLMNVAEPDVSKVTPGQAVEFSVSPWPGEMFPAKVKHIGAALRGGARDLIVEAETANASGRLRPGLFAEVRLLLEPKPALAVPSGAIRRDGTRSRLWVVEKDVLSERLVETGESADGLTEIISGVREGESVVDNPGEGAADGAPAQVTAKP